MTIYAGLDPYRDSLQSELNYTNEKLEAGADGLFTQPFFDLRWMEIYADHLPQRADLLGRFAGADREIAQLLGDGQPGGLPARLTT